MADWRNEKAYEGKYLAGGVDLKPGQQVNGIVTYAEVEEMGQGNDKQEKIVVRFKGNDKGLVMNKTNCKKMAEITGTNDYDNWLNKVVGIKCVSLEVSGEDHEVLRICNPEQGKPTWGDPVQQQTVAQAGVPGNTTAQIQAQQAAQPAPQAAPANQPEPAQPAPQAAPAEQPKAAIPAESATTAPPESQAKPEATAEKAAEKPAAPAA